VNQVQRITSSVAEDMSEHIENIRNFAGNMYEAAVSSTGDLHCFHELIEDSTIIMSGQVMDLLELSSRS
jgi:hypothetical protein